MERTGSAYRGRRRLISCFIALILDQTVMVTVVVEVVVVIVVVIEQL